MKTLKQIGVWMDNSNACLMELTNGIIVQNNIDSDFTHDEKELSLKKGEKSMHNKEQAMQKTYYKKISESIRDYDEVVLFGPTNAKTELLNKIKDDHRFDKIKIDVEESDKMTETQMREFVCLYFN